MPTVSKYNNDPLAGYLRKVSIAESGGNAKAKNPLSSATGKYQFTEGTWKAIVKENNLGYTLNDRNDPEKSEVVMRAFTNKNENYLKPIVGRELNDADRYLGHFLGAGGAGSFFRALNSNQDAPISTVLSPAAISANRSVVYNKDGSIKTVGELYNWANKKMGQTVSIPQQEKEIQLYVAPNYQITTQNLSNLPVSLNNTNLAPEEDKATLIKQQIEDKYKERLFMAELIKKSQVQYVEPEEYL